MYIYHQKEKKPKREHIPPFSTTLKIYKVETPCCWEMRIEKGEKTQKRSRFCPCPPQELSLKQICRVEKAASL